MAKHIHIHVTPKKPQVAALLRAKVNTKDADTIKYYRDYAVWREACKKAGLDIYAEGAASGAYLAKKSGVVYGRFSKSRGAGWIDPPAGTKDADPSDLQARRDKLEAEFDKADDSGDNRALERIRKELANLDKQIAESKKKETASAEDSFKEYSVKMEDGSRVVVGAASPENAKERAEAKTGKKAVMAVPRQPFGKNTTADAGLKLIKTLPGEKTMVKVFYNDEWEEFEAKLYYKKPFGWQEQNKASYHSDDKEDALSTAADMLKRAEARTKD